MSSQPIIPNTAVILSALLALLGLAALVQFPFSLNHDAAWHFYTATRVLAGDRIGLDVADINPPMAMWLFSLPGLLVGHLGASPALVYRCFTLLLALICLSACLMPAQRLLGREAPRMLLAVGAIFLLLPAYDFGQREHLVALLTLPYLFLAAQVEDDQAATVAGRILIGVLAGIGVCFKPYFLAVPLAVELLILAQRRNWRTMLRPELLAMGAVGVAFLAAVALFAPDYLGRVVPDALRTYSGYERPLAIVLGEAGVVLLFPAMALLIGLVAAPRLHTLTSIFLAAALGFLVAALLQQKGWAYQMMPAALYVLAAAIVQAVLAKRLQLLTATAIALAGLHPVAMNLGDHLSPNGTSARVSQLELALTQPDISTVYAFITSPRDMHPAVLASGVRWADAYGVMMFLPGQLAAQSAPVSDARAGEATVIADTYLTDMLGRFNKTPPDVLAFDVGSYKLGLPNGREFDYMAFLAPYPGFEALMARYDEIEPIGRFRLFRLREGA